MDGVLGGAAAGGVGAALNGGNVGLGMLSGAAFGGIAGGVGPGLNAAFGGGLQGALGSGALLGAAFGGINAAVAGKNLGAGLLSGMVSGALLAGALYGAQQLYAATRSPAIASPGQGNADGVVSSTDYGEALTGDRLQMVGKMVSQYQGVYGRNISGVRFNIGGAAAENHMALAVSDDLIVLNEQFFGEYTPPDVRYKAIGHECFHIHIARTMNTGRCEYGIRDVAK